MKKVIWILIAIVLVVGIAYLVTRELNKGEKVENKITNTTSNTTTKIENKVNETSNIQTNTIENTVTNTENTVENTTIEKTNTETFNEAPQTEEEKAISIVKKDWGANDVSVKFLVEGINDDGTYIVTVRDSATTEAQAFYKVDIKNGSFTKKDMI